MIPQVKDCLHGRGIILENQKAKRIGAHMTTSDKSLVLYVKNLSPIA